MGASLKAAEGPERRRRLDVLDGSDSDEEVLVASNRQNTLERNQKLSLACQGNGQVCASSGATVLEVSATSEPVEKDYQRRVDYALLYAREKRMSVATAWAVDILFANLNILIWE